MPGILTCPLEVTIRILASCDSFYQVVSLISTCRQLAAIWEANSSTLIPGLLLKSNIPAFDDALMAVSLSAPPLRR